MKRPIRFVRRQPLLACSLAANAVLAFGFALDHNRQFSRLEECLEIAWRADGSYVRWLGEWNAAVESGDEARLGQLSFYAQSLAETREVNRGQMLAQGLEWAR